MHPDPGGSKERARKKNGVWNGGGLKRKRNGLGVLWGGLMKKTMVEGGGRLMYGES